MPVLSSIRGPAGPAGRNPLLPTNFDTVVFTYTVDGFDNVATATYSLLAVTQAVLTYTYNGSGDLIEVTLL